MNCKFGQSRSTVRKYLFFGKKVFCKFNIFNDTHPKNELKNESIFDISKFDKFKNVNDLQSLNI